VTRSPAVLTVDVHRGHFDPERATLPVPEETGERVLANTADLTARARRADVPVIHVTTEYRSSAEILGNPNVEHTSEDAREKMPEHNLAGSGLREIMPAVYDDEDVIANPKKGFSPFLTTDLEYILRTRDIDDLIVAGVNTNTCVQCTSFEAYNRGYGLTVVEDCVGSMYGEEFHEWGIANIDAALGTVVSLDDVEFE
jgi:nicotinamidase-related amidase